IKNPGNTGTIEMSILLKQLVDKDFRRKKIANKKSKYAKNRDRYLAEQQKKNSPLKATAPTPIKATLTSESSLAHVTATDSLKENPGVLTKNAQPIGGATISDRLSQKLQQKQDSVMASAKAGQAIHQALVLEKVNLHFNFKLNSADLDEQSKEYITDLAKVLKENPALRVELTGHTDNTGTAFYNLRLSRFRAESIKSILVGEGVSPEAIKTDGKGFNEPLNDNNTEEEKAINRRVELLILYDF
ncbi:MAG: OmpA family protein, partial [Cyclobacteriaceae bacterium]|nr:OmpA family protein [Cyclobacteriaceae bacterium]